MHCLEQMTQSHTLYFSSHFEGSSEGYINREGDSYRWQSVEAKQ
nr:MBL fold metallo-hydrolase [Serratia proteamaculans]